MKKIKSLFLLCAVTMLLSGCSLKYEYNMSIKKDKSMDFSVILAMDEELIDAMISMKDQSDNQTEPTEEDRWAAFEESSTEEDDPAEFGFKEERYREGDYYGYKYTKKISNIDDISGEEANFKLDEFQNISDKVVFVKDGEKYKANLVLSSEEQSENTQGYDIGIDMLFVVTLPNEPISHNATNVSEDGKTLTWNLLKESSKNIEFEFEMKENSNMILYVGIAAGVVILLIVIGLIASNSKKDKKGNTANVQNAQSQVAPTQPMIQPQVAPTEPMAQPQVAPTEPMIQPQVAPTQPMIQPQVAPTQPMIQPQVAPTQPMAQPQVAPTEPMAQPQVAPTEPMAQPQVAPTQPVNQMPSVADILGLPTQNNNQ